MDKLKYKIGDWVRTCFGETGQVIEINPPGYYGGRYTLKILNESYIRVTDELSMEYYISPLKKFLKEKKGEK